MADFTQASHYEHLKKQYSRYSLPQIIEKLINEMQVNQLKSKTMLKMQARINELESQRFSRGISLTHTKDPKLKQLKEAYQLRQTEKSQKQKAFGKEIETDRGTPRRSSKRDEFKYRELNTTKTPEREDRDIFSSRSPRVSEFQETISENVKTIAELTLKNQSLQSQMSSLKQDLNALNFTHQNICSQIQILKRSEQILMRENNELTLDCRYRISEYQKSVDIIQKLLSQLQQFKGLHSQKSKVIKDITNTNHELQSDMDQYMKSIDQYQRKEQQLLENQGQYEEQIIRLKEVNAENDIIIDKLGKQNIKLAQQFRLQVHNNSLLEQVMKEMRDRNHLLQKKIFEWEREKKELEGVIKSQQKQMNKALLKNQECGKMLQKVQHENVKIKQQFLKTSEQFKQQINVQLKLINDYERIQKPKQLTNLKERFKGEEKHKQFKLNTFNQKLHEKVVVQEKSKHRQIYSPNKTIKQVSKQDILNQSKYECQEQDRSRRLKTTSEGLKGLVISIENKMSQLMGTYDALNSKTAELAKKMPNTPHN